MGRRKTTVVQDPEELTPNQLPEQFDHTLLAQPSAVRLEYFEKNCMIEHPFLMRACSEIMQAVCSPGTGPNINRPGTMVLVIGPTRVGKTTLIGLIKEMILVRTQERMLREPDYIPYISMSATSPGSGSFDWVDYYFAVLRQVNDPFLKCKHSLIRGRDLRGAMEEALLQCDPVAVMVDEAHHLAKATSGRRLQDQLDHLKSIENRTHISHILFGTYEMEPFRKVNAQLACRSIDVHFPRYDATKSEELTAFRSVVWAFQRHLPVKLEPPLAEKYWEFLYARSIGCIGLLKMHLNRALAHALDEDSPTLTEKHLQATAIPEARVNLALRAALSGEANLSEKKGADDRLLTLLGLRDHQANPSNKSNASSPEDQQPKPSSGSNRNKPGNRLPNRDAVGRSTALEEEVG